MTSSVRLLDRGLWLVEASIGDLDVRGAVIVGRECTVVFDTLAHPDHMRPVNRLVRGSWLAAVYSHADWDHVWGTGGLSRPPDQIIAHHDCHARFSSELPKVLLEKRVEDDRWNGVILMRPSHTFSTDETLDVGAATLELHHLPGHTTDSIVGLVPEWGVLLAGDAVETPLPVVNDGRAVPGWIERLTRWADDPRVRTVVPAHGQIGGSSLIERTVEYLASLLEDRPVSPPADVSPFYRRAHRTNLGRMRFTDPGE